ncbi:MAG: hypothetical protein ACXABD_15260, partial [Candidatus Thorarchaeota archaeon]
GLSFAQQDAESDYHWGYSSGPTASDVDGFVYSDDGLNWTQHWDFQGSWSGRYGAWAIAWRSFSGDF